MPTLPTSYPVVVIGGGPAGLMAADVISAHGLRVDLYDAMPSVGRKFLLAGIGGLNLTHAEATAQFQARYGARLPALQSALDAFDANAVRAWAAELGVETFVGSSGRVFPIGMKAAPLLRNWLRKLRAAGVQLHSRQRWLGWGSFEGERKLRFRGEHGEHVVNASAVVLALGGGSWARLGSDGAWVPLLEQAGVAIAPLQPANCGFEVEWSAHFSEHHAGQPLKSVAMGLTQDASATPFRRGEAVITRNGIEGGLVYALSAPLRDTLQTEGAATLWLDLAPDRSLERLQTALAKPRGARSLAKHLHSCAGIDGVKAALLREVLSPAQLQDMACVTATIKALPLRLRATRPLDEAISSAGGVRFDNLDEFDMLRTLPGYFCAGEMLDWEAPTGGYLLTACLASGRRAGAAAVRWLQERAGMDDQSPTHKTFI